MEFLVYVLPLLTFLITPLITNVSEAYQYLLLFSSQQLVQSFLGTGGIQLSVLHTELDSPHLGVVDRRLATPKRACYSALIGIS